MKTTRKILIALLVVLTLLMSVFSLTTLAADAGEGADTITIYFRNDWLWDKVTCHYWGSAGSSQWPGVVMTKVDTQYSDIVDGDRDIYSVTIPAGSSILFSNNGNESSKTPDITTGVVDGAAFTIYWDGSNKYKAIDYTPVVDPTPDPDPETPVDPNPTPDPEPVAPDYYLVGWINGADYGCNGDYLNLGDYKFVDGTLVATFNADSYVFIKTSDNNKWYLFETYCESTSGTLYESKSEKMFVPGGVEVTFTLVENEDGSLTLSYTTAQPSEPVANDYYLVGYIGNEDYTGNDYKFVDGNLVVTFKTDSYIIVKDQNNKWYFFENYCNSTSGTLYAGKSEKMFAPGGVELTLTLVENEDGTLTLSYTYPCIKGHSYADATCTAPKTCSVCGATEGSALEHPYVEGTCPNCGATDPTYCAHTDKTLINTATCTEGGKIYYDCDNCDAIFDEQDSEPLGHKYENGVCSADGCTYVITYFVNAAKWNSVCAYAWTGSGSGWPGVAMTKTDLTVNGYDIYVVEFAHAYDNIIFNNNGNGSQTADLTFTAGKYYDLSSKAWYSTIDEIPEYDPLSTDNFLAGSMNGWNTTTHNFMLKAEGETIGYIVIELDANTTYEFKIVKSGAWLGCNTTITESVVDYVFYGSEALNAKITTKYAGAYVFAFDSNGDKLSITFFDPCAEGHSYSDATCTDPKTCSVCGATDGAALGHNYKEGVCSACGAKDPDYCAHEHKTLVNTATCTESGKIYYDCDNCDAIFDEQDSEPLGHKYNKYGKCNTCGQGDIYTVAGVEELCGSYWNPEDVNNNLIFDENTGVYTIVYTDVKAGIYELKVVKNNSWDNAFGGDGKDGNYVLEVKGDYSTVTITVDSEGMKVSVHYLESESDKTYYLVPGAWNADGAWYAIYYFNSNNNTNGWVKMELVEGHIYYSATVPAGNTNFIFVRLNPEATEPSWDSKWNQTADIPVYADGDVYVFAAYGEGEGAADDFQLHTHAYESVVTPNSCTAQGYTTYTCSCGDSYKADVTPVKPHEHTNTVVTDPTCVDKGYTTYSCVCGDSYKADYVDALGHTEVVDEAKAPTCTETGLTAGSHCSVCNAPIVVQQPVAANGHSFGEWYEHVPATEHEKGEKRRDCSACDAYESSPIAELTHDHNRYTPVVLPGKAPTCTATGLTEGKMCPECKEVLVPQNTIPATGHTEVTIPGKAATCTATGLTDGKECSVCHTVLSKQQLIGVLGHTEVVDEAVAPTCTADGLTAGRHCSVCNTVTLAQEVDPALGHNMVTDAAKAPTCTESGLTEGAHCTRCDGATVAQQSVPAKGHTLADATCTAPKTCTVCGATEGEALGHSFADATCTAPKTCACGATEGEALGHTYFYNLCLVCYAPNPHFITNSLVVGSNKVVCNEYHLVGDGQNGNHTFPYEFVLLTVTEDGKYSISGDMVGVTIFLTEITTEGADFSTNGASWLLYDITGTAELKAGTYYVGLVYVLGQGEYNVSVEKLHEHSFVEGKCECGESDPNYVPPHEHNFVEGKCECGESDPDYVAPEQPEQPEPQPELNFFEKIWAAILGFFASIGAFFKGLFS